MTTIYPSQHPTSLQTRHRTAATTVATTHLSLYMHHGHTHSCHRWLMNCGIHDTDQSMPCLVHGSTCVSTPRLIQQLPIEEEQRRIIIMNHHHYRIIMIVIVLPPRGVVLKLIMGVTNLTISRVENVNSVTIWTKILFGNHHHHRRRLIIV